MITHLQKSISTLLAFLLVLTYPSTLATPYAWSVSSRRPVAQEAIPDGLMDAFLATVARPSQANAEANPITVDSLVYLEQKVIAADDWFGVSVALDSDTALVEVFLEDVGSNEHQGSAYFYQLSSPVLFAAGSERRAIIIALLFQARIARLMGFILVFFFFFLGAPPPPKLTLKASFPYTRDIYLTRL